mmetsp:Transcript_82705/g.215870  ORF Transcript_82705/g.215870 Transcript_82705/m.215870 type:complete len:219 (+) Transcript_82705:121-777(+)
MRAAVNQHGHEALTRHGGKGARRTNRAENTTTVHCRRSALRVRHEPGLFRRCVAIQRLELRVKPGEIAQRQLDFPSRQPQEFSTSSVKPVSHPGQCLSTVLTRQRRPSIRNSRKASGVTCGSCQGSGHGSPPSSSSTSLAAPHKWPRLAPQAMRRARPERSLAAHRSRCCTCCRRAGCASAARTWRSRGTRARPPTGWQPSCPRAGCRASCRACAAAS